MATLKCNSCGGEIASNARRIQCPHCAALFPFACAHCGRNLRPPFAESADERYLTVETPPRPLCEEHYLRKCPDCQQWFGADENPGYFRCPACAERRNAAPPEAEIDDDYQSETGARETGAPATLTQPASAPAKAGGGCGAAVVLLVGAGSALFYLGRWLLLAG